MPDQFPKKIVDIFIHTFSIDNFGLYSLKITARCQRADLRVEIDGIKFREIPPENKPQYNNIPPSWNGSKLKGKSKTVIFIIKINKGKHNIKFVPTGEANIEHFSIQEITDFSNIQFNLGKKVEERDRISWLTFALIDLPLYSFSADISIGWHWFDGDDVKLIIDNKIKKNSSSILHKNWIWSAGLSQIFSGIKREEKSFTEKLTSGTHYIEFWVDKTPTFHKITLNLGNFLLKRIPTVDDPEWTGDFRDDTNIMILARVLFGEARNQLVPDEIRTAIGWVIKNRVIDLRWSNTYWEVITQSKQFSSFNKNDPNRKYVENPFYNNSDINRASWKHSYEIACKIINHLVKDPTKGANHYYDDSINMPDWAKNLIPTLKITYKNQYSKDATVYFFRL